jgi:hypothetical protein
MEEMEDYFGGGREKELFLFDGFPARPSGIRYIDKKAVK